MKTFRSTLITFSLVVLAFPLIGFSQDDMAKEIDCEVNRVYPYISIERHELNKAKSLADLNKYYKSSWVREYISVEISVSHKGETRKAKSNNGTLSQKQKEIMNMADVGKDILVEVRYLPENTLSHNDVKEVNFTFIVEPENKARYSGGQDQLNQYLKESAIDKIPEGSFEQYELAAVKFTIDEQGDIIDAHLFETTGDEEIDEVLLETVCNMPGWIPAEYSNGVKVKQEFVFTVGNMESCVVNLLNIRREFD